MIDSYFTALTRRDEGDLHVRVHLTPRTRSRCLTPHKTVNCDVRETCPDNEQDWTWSLPANAFNITRIVWTQAQSEPARGARHDSCIQHRQVSGPGLPRALPRTLRTLAVWSPSDPF